MGHKFIIAMGIGIALSPCHGSIRGMPLMIGTYCMDLLRIHVPQMHFGGSCQFDVGITFEFFHDMRNTIRWVKIIIIHGNDNGTLCLLIELIAFGTDTQLLLMCHIAKVRNGFGRLSEQITDLVSPVIQNDPLHFLFGEGLTAVDLDKGGEKLTAIVGGGHD